MEILKKMVEVVWDKVCYIMINYVCLRIGPWFLKPKVCYRVSDYPNTDRIGYCVENKSMKSFCVTCQMKLRNGFKALEPVDIVKIVITEWKPRETIENSYRGEEVFKKESDAISFPVSLSPKAKIRIDFEFGMDIHCSAFSPIVESLEIINPTEEGIRIIKEENK